MPLKKRNYKIEITLPHGEVWNETFSRIPDKEFSSIKKIVLRDNLGLEITMPCGDNTIDPSVLTNIVIVPATAELHVQDSQLFRVIGFNGLGQELEFNATIAWAVNNTDAFSIDGNGLLFVKSFVSTGIVYAFVGSFGANVGFKVIAEEPASISTIRMIPDGGTFSEGEIVLFTITAYDAQGKFIPTNLDEYTVVSSDVGIVDVTSSSTLDCISDGVATLTVTHISTGVESSPVFTVDPDPVIDPPDPPDPVNRPPTPGFDITADFLEVTITSTASDPDAGDSIASTHYDYGDGNDADDPSDPHVYEYDDPGDYTITQTVTDTHGAVSVLSIPHTVVESPDPPPLNTAPIASLVLSNVNLTVSADASGSTDDDPGDSIVNYKFTWGDGYIDTGTSATRVHLYGTAGIKTVTLDVTDEGGLVGSVTKQITVSTPTSSGNVTPNELIKLLGPMVLRSNNPSQWPALFETKLDSAITFNEGRILGGFSSYLTGAPNQDNPHYGYLSMVIRRNIRAGLSISPTGPNMPAAIKITKDYVQLYAKPNAYNMQPHQSTNALDVALVWWLYKDEPAGSANKILSDDCYNYVRTLASKFATSGYPSLTGGWVNPNIVGKCYGVDWMDHRSAAMPLQLYSIATWMGTTYKSDLGTTGSYRTDHERQANNLVLAQVDTFNRFGSMSEPAGPIQNGEIRWRGHSWAYSDQSNTNSVKVTTEPLAKAFFAEWMLVHELEKANIYFGRNTGLVPSKQMADTNFQHYRPTKRLFGYLSRYVGAPTGGDNDAPDLNNFGVVPCLRIWERTGDINYFNLALNLVNGSLVASGWNWRMKNNQELGNVNDIQTAPAIIKGVVI